MKENMLKISLRNVLMVAAGLLVVLPSVHAQNVNSSSFDVPFQFSVNNMILPAGTYLVGRASKPLGDPSMLIIQEAGRKGAARMFITNAMERAISVEQSKLVFTCYGNDCFLSQVWAQNEDLARKTVTTRKERLLARQSSPHREVVLARMQ